MPKIWHYQQKPEAYSTDPDVMSGVCMVMTYYVLKRFLAGPETTPDILDRKMSLFVSMQRAGEWDVKLSGIQWIKMLGRGDNLQAKLGDYSDSFDEALQEGLGSVGALADAGVEKFGVYLSMKWKGHGHGIGIMVDLGSQSFEVFDPNLGLYGLGDSAFQDDFERTYKEPGRIGVVLLTGTPRDLKSLALD
jgi:hypothetical protein